MAAISDGTHTRQKLSLFSVVVVMVFVGLPLWWKTTAVYRSYLPYSDIQELKYKQVPPVTISIDLVGLLDISKYDVVFHKVIKHYSRKVLAFESNVTIQCSIQLKTYDKPVKDTIMESIRNDQDIPPSLMGHYTVFMVDDLSQNSTVLFSSYRYVTVKNTVSENELLNVLSVLCGLDRMEQLLMEKSVHKGHSHKPVRVKISPGYQITMTMISPTHSLARTKWTIEKATNNVLMPFLRNEGVSMLGQFTISSQVLYYTDVQFNPKYSRKHNSFMINASTLPSMISTIEARLGSHVSQWPSLNFVIYVPEHSERPLYITGADGGVVDAFLVPQWGGVILYNDVIPSNASDDIEEVVKMEDIMWTVVDQLKLLFGVNQLIKETRFHQINNNPLSVPKWDIDHVLISRALESVVMATSSLYSLTSLLDDVKNMVISDHIQEEVLTSMQEINQFYNSCSNQRWESAYIAATSALKHSEAAFFDPSILALLYFPDDQKYAIYIPLFLPISVPVAIGFIRTVKKFRKQ